MNAALPSHRAVTVLVEDAARLHASMEPCARPVASMIAMDLRWPRSAGHNESHQAALLDRRISGTDLFLCTDAGTPPPAQLQAPASCALASRVPLMPHNRVQWWRLMREHEARSRCIHPHGCTSCAQTRISQAQSGWWTFISGCTTASPTALSYS